MKLTIVHTVCTLPLDRADGKAQYPRNGTDCGVTDPVPVHTGIIEVIAYKNHNEIGRDMIQREL